MGGAPQTRSGPGSRRGRGLAGGVGVGSEGCGAAGGGAKRGGALPPAGGDAGAPRLVTRYRLGREGYIRFLLGSTSIADLLRRRRLFNVLLKSDLEAIALLRTQADATKAARDELLAAHVEQDQSVNAEAERRGARPGQQEPQRTPLASLHRGQGARGEGGRGVRGGAGRRAGGRRSGHGRRNGLAQGPLSVLRVARRAEAARSGAVAVTQAQGPTAAGGRQRRRGEMKRFLVLCACAMLGGFVAVRVAQAARDPAGPYRKLHGFSHVLSLVENNYVEPVDEAKLVYGAIDGMIHTLDPHSSFMDPRSYAALKEETEGEYGGVGLERATPGGAGGGGAPIHDPPPSRAGFPPGGPRTGTPGPP